MPVSIIIPVAISFQNLRKSSCNPLLSSYSYTVLYSALRIRKSLLTSSGHPFLFTMQCGVNTLAEAGGGVF